MCDFFMVILPKKERKNVFVILIDKKRNVINEKMCLTLRCDVIGHRFE